MHIHLIPIEISIVWCTHRQVQPECVVGEDSDSMSHHTHSMKSRLSVEEDVVTVL